MSSGVRSHDVSSREMFVYADTDLSAAHALGRNTVGSLPPAIAAPAGLSWKAAEEIWEKNGAAAAAAVRSSAGGERRASGRQRAERGDWASSGQSPEDVFLLKIHGEPPTSAAAAAGQYSRVSALGSTASQPAGAADPPYVHAGAPPKGAGRTPRPNADRASARAMEGAGEAAGGAGLSEPRQGPPSKVTRRSAHTRRDSGGGGG